MAVVLIFCFPETELPSVSAEEAVCCRTRSNALVDITRRCLLQQVSNLARRQGPEGSVRVGVDGGPSWKMKLPLGPNPGMISVQDRQHLKELDLPNVLGT